MSRRRVLQTSGVAVVASLAGCGGGGAGDSGGSIDADYTYSLGEETHEESIEIAVGQTVSWEAESGTHFVRRRDRPEESEWTPPSSTAISGGQTYQHTFEVAGTYVWECDYHRGPYTIEVTA